MLRIRRPSPAAPVALHYDNFRRTTGEHFKATIQIMTGVQVANMRLFYNNRFIVDDARLCDPPNNVTPDSFVMNLIDIIQLTNAIINQNWPFAFPVNHQSVLHWLNGQSAEYVDLVARLAEGDVVSDETTFATEFNEFILASPAILRGLLSNHQNFAAQFRNYRDNNFPTLSFYDIPLDSNLFFNQDYAIFFFSRWTNQLWFDHLLMIHKQVSDLCFLHAPVVMAHYEVTIGSNGEDTKLVDIGKLQLSNIMNSQGNIDEFIQFLQSPQGGGNSKQILNSLLNLHHLYDYDSFYPQKSNPNVNNQSRSFKNYWQELIVHLLEGHPALVKDFHIHEGMLDHEFGNPISGEPVGDEDGYHAMILIGIIKEGNNYYVVLQNWWSGEYLITMDVNCFACCSPTIHFVNKSNGQPPAYDTNYVQGLTYQFTHFAETAVDQREHPRNER